MVNLITRRSWLRSASSILLTALILSGLPLAQAAGKGKIKGPGAFNNTINLAPNITSLQLANGQLVASGTVTATLKGQTTTTSFTAPVSVAVAPNQAGATCPVLDLTLGPIDLNLLGLVVETSPICLQIIAHEGGGLLGDLLCQVGNLLNGGLDLGQILSGIGLVDPTTGAVLIPGIDPNQLLSGLTDVLNSTLSNLLNSILTALQQAGGSCDILHLELGPLDLTLLGLEVILDDCSGGPVVVDVSAVTGQGNLLGNLLCQLLGSGSINLGSTLQTILNQILALLNA